MDGYTDTGRTDRYMNPEVKVVTHSTKSLKERFQPRKIPVECREFSAKDGVLHVAVWDASLESV